MKKAYFLGGIFICIISISIAFTNKEKISLVTNGEIIEVTILDVPVPCHTRNRTVKPFFRFKYNNKTYSKNLKDKYCNIIYNTKKLSLKTNSDKTLFVYTNETLTTDLITSLILCLIGLFLIYKGVKK